VEHGFGPDEFTMRNVPGRIRRRGDLWKPLLGARGRFPLEEIL
jgi:DNA primase